MTQPLEFYTSVPIDTGSDDIAYIQMSTSDFEYFYLDIVLPEQFGPLVDVTYEIEGDADRIVYWLGGFDTYPEIVAVREWFATLATKGDNS